MATDNPNATDRIPGRLTYEPLARHVRDRIGADAEPTAIAKFLGVSPRTIHRWIEDGITTTTADEIAVRIGSHAYIVWGQKEFVFADITAGLMDKRARWNKEHAS